MRALPLLLLILTAAHSIRLIGGSQRALATFDGILAPAHYLPGIGDAIAGAGALLLVCAPVIRGVTPSVLQALWFWNFYGAADLLLAIPINVLWPPADPRFLTPLLALSFLAVHGVQLWLLRRERCRLSLS